MTTLRSRSLSAPSAISPKQPGDVQKAANPSGATLAKALAWHHEVTDPSRTQLYHRAFQAALANDGLRAEYNQALSTAHPEVAKAMASAGAAPSTGWVPGSRAADLPTEVAANWLAETLVNERPTSTREGVKARYESFRSALASDELRSKMDRCLISTDRALARELGVIR